MKAVVVDSGVGNIPNAMRGLVRAGAEPVLCADPETIRTARCIVLPGVGAFPPAMACLRERGLDEALRAAAAAGAAILGICLGHQLLFEASEEFGETAGLRLIPGRVSPLPPGGRVPHMGWSRITARRDDPLLAGLGGGAWMFFVHSFAAAPGNGDVLATVRFGAADVCAVARRGRVCGVQFHPEKSGAAGARLLANFLALARSEERPGTGDRGPGTGDEPQVGVGLQAGGVPADRRQTQSPTTPQQPKRRGSFPQRLRIRRSAPGYREGSAWFGFPGPRSPVPGSRDGRGR